MMCLIDKSVNNHPKQNVNHQCLDNKSSPTRVVLSRQQEPSISRILNPTSTMIEEQKARSLPSRGQAVRNARPFHGEYRSVVPRDDEVFCRGGFTIAKVAREDEAFAGDASQSPSAQDDTNN
jgi:hypothetical protein